jgi:Kef-type K+ transport system membrane component KefB
LKQTAVRDFTELAIIIGVAAFFAIFSRKLRQPELLGFVLAGIILGPIFHIIKPEEGSLELFSEIGVAFLLFIVGLELNPHEVKQLGIRPLLAGVLQVLITIILGAGLSLLLGFNLVTAVFIGLALSFSSTIIIVKLLSQKRELDTLHGKLSVVFLVVQDFIAIFALILLSIFKDFKSEELTSEIIALIAKGLLITVILVVVSKYIFPFLLKFINRERETLFISVIAWALIFAAFVSSQFIGFSIEIGALLAGVTLASRYESLQIESWMRPLRDFFLTLFFVLLGVKININTSDNIVLPIIVFSIFTIVGKTAISFLLIKAFKYPKRVSFVTGVSLAQISEFSLLLLGIAVADNFISSTVVGIITVVAGITMVISSYMIMFHGWFYKKLRFVLRADLVHEIEDLRLSEKPIFVLGAHRTGKNILDYLVKKYENVIVVDHNPASVEYWKKSGVKAILGDLHDEDLLNHLNLSQAQYIISTIPIMEINKLIMSKLEENKEERPLTILLAKEEDEVAELYAMGADYVVYPYLLTGESVKSLLKKKPDVDLHKIKMLSRVLNKGGM